MKVGLIGCGHIGEKRAQAILKAGHKLVMAIDTDLNRAKQLAGRYLCEDYSSDWPSMMSKSLDLIVIATPHHWLAPIAIEAINRGKHVLVEKPGATKPKDMKMIRDTAEKNEIMVKVGFNHRFHPALAQAYHLYQSGTIGKILFIRGHYGHGGRPDYEKEWRCDPTLSGGGELIDQGCHLIDLSQWFLGKLQLHASQLTNSYWKSTVEDNCFLILTNDQKQTAFLHASWTQWKNRFCFEIIGEKGIITIDGLGGNYGMETLTLYERKILGAIPDKQTWKFQDSSQSFFDEYQHFSDCIQLGRQPYSSIRETYDLAVLIQRIYKENYYVN